MPPPEEDETLHSLLIVAFRLSGHMCFRSFTKLIFGMPSDGRGACWRFKSIGVYLDPCRATASAVLNSTLLSSFITPFRSPEDAKRFENRLDGDYSKECGGRKPNWEIRNRRPLRYCPICVRNGLKTTGRSAWLRSHQLAGVEVCWKHGAFLISVLQTPRFPKLPHEFDDQHAVYCFNKAKVWWARQTRELLWANHAPSLSVHRREVYRTQAALLGYGSHKRIDSNLIASHILQKFGNAFLNQIIGGYDRKRLTQLVYSAISGCETSLHPTIHILCIDALFGEQRTFFQKLRAQKSNSASSILVDQDLKEERHEVNVHRRVFLSELKIHGRDVMLYLDRHFPLTHSWILANDLMWSRRRIAQLVPDGPDRLATLRTEARLQQLMGNSIRDERRRVIARGGHDFESMRVDPLSERAAAYAFVRMAAQLRAF